MDNQKCVTCNYNRCAADASLDTIRYSYTNARLEILWKIDHNFWTIIHASFNFQPLLQIEDLHDIQFANRLKKATFSNIQFESYYL